MDQSLSRAGDVVAEAQKAVQESKITVAAVRQEAQSLARAAASQRLGTQLRLQADIARLESGLAKAGLLLDTSRATAEDIHQALLLSSQLGIPLQPEILDPVLETLTRLQSSVQAAQKAVPNAGPGNRDDDTNGSTETLGERALRVTTRVGTTFGEIDTRLGRCRSRLTDAQGQIASLRRQAHRRILAVAIVATLLLVWMAGGQISLWRRGLHGGATGPPGS
jgi:hypothetical protein